MTIFDYLTPIPETLLYRRNDPNDVRLGEVVCTRPTDYESAQVVILGCPQDEGVQRNQGRVGAAQAPDAVRQALYRLVAPENAGAILFDMGNTHIHSTLEQTHALHRNIVQKLVDDGKRVISIGGGNDLSYPDCSGLAGAISDVLAINVDAHFDVRADAVRNSGTPYRQLLDESFVMPEKFFEVGSIPAVNSPAHRDYLLDKGAHIIDLATLLKRGISDVFAEILTHEAEAIFFGLDMDVVHVSDAPGVSAPNALGISAHDFCLIASIAGRDPRCKVFEITEVNPVYDIDSRTARLAGMAIYQFLSHIDC